MKEKFLITGGRGFIGTGLMRALGHKWVESFDMVDGCDLRDYEQVYKAVKRKTAVFHLAAVADLNWARKYPIETMEINLQGTWNVARACMENKARLYFASTCCVYGNQNIHPASELTLPNPAEIYACSKLAGENIIKGFYLTYGLEYNMMRFATIYGEGTRPALATHIFLGQAIRGESITVHGDGRQTRTLTYIGDLIDAIVALYRSGKKNNVWNMTTAEEISALQMAQDIKRITNSQSEIRFIPQRVGQTYKECISADKMKNEIGWEAKVSWNEGLQKMYEWYVKTNQQENQYIMPS